MVNTYIFVHSGLASVLEIIRAIDTLFTVLCDIADEGYYLFNDKQVKIEGEETNGSSYMEDIFTQDITITLWNWW